MNRRITYLRTTKGQPVGCIAIVVDPKENESRKAHYQFSVLNPIDNFDRKLARQLAIGRLVENPKSVDIGDDADMHSITRSIMMDLLAAKNTPTRAFKAAKLWIRTYPDGPKS